MIVKMEIPNDVVLYHFSYIDETEIHKNTNEQLQKLAKLKGEVCTLSLEDALKNNTLRLNAIRKESK